MSVKNLSPKQLGIINLISQGKTTKEIAIELDVTDHTVESYKVDMYKKCHIRTAPQLIFWAFQNGVLKVA